VNEKEKKKGVSPNHLNGRRKRGEEQHGQTDGKEETDPLLLKEEEKKGC